MACTAAGTAVQGQFANIGSVTATPPCGPGVSAQDPSHYFGGGDVGLSLQKRVNNQDIAAPPGPSITAGQPVTWQYILTNVGQVPLSNVSVADDRGVTVSCPSTTLAAGASMTCTASGKAQACQYQNIGLASGQAASGQQATAADPSYYFGTIQPGIQVETRINSQDADTSPGPEIPLNSPLTWAYTVTNTGNSVLSNVLVGDDRLGPVSCPKTTLQPGEQMTCYVPGTAAAGQYDTQGSVTADPPCGSPVSDDDGTHYFGGGISGLQVNKLVNGQDAPWPGLPIQVGQQVVWSYTVTNSGQVPLTGIGVTDDDPAVTVSCPKTALQPGESMTCSSNKRNAQACQYVNVATATAQGSGGTVRAFDSSAYQGQFTPAIQIETSVNGKDADTAPGAFITGGSTIDLKYLVTNVSTVTLTNVRVRDDQGVQVSCPQASLVPGQSMTCTAGSTATVGASRNLGIVTADPPCGVQISAEDPSHYFGTLPVSIDIQKFTNGLDVAQPSGLILLVGSPVSWKYVVKNTGQAPLSGIVAGDDKGVAVTCPKTVLQPGEAMNCTGSGTATLGDYTNTGSVSAQTPYSTTVNDSDTSHYRGAVPGIEVETTTNNLEDDSIAGAAIVAGQSFTRRYTLTNTGPFELVDIAVADTAGMTVNCNGITTLAAGATLTCIATDTAGCGPHPGTATATGKTASGQTVTDSDPGNYAGTEAPNVTVSVAVDGQHHGAPPGPSYPPLSFHTFSYRVENASNVPISNMTVTENVPPCNAPPSLPANTVFICSRLLAVSLSAGQRQYSVTVTGQSLCGTSLSAIDTTFYVVN
jgi:uncharacterized repeat protein (TIGR01451 family)